MGFCGASNDENDYEIGYREGAAAALGLVAMAEAIRTRDEWTHNFPFCARVAPYIASETYCPIHGPIPTRAGGW